MSAEQVFALCAPFSCKKSSLGHGAPVAAEDKFAGKSGNAFRVIAQEFRPPEAAAWAQQPLPMSKSTTKNWFALWLSTAVWKEANKNWVSVKRAWL